MRIPQAAGLATESLSAHIGQRFDYGRADNENRVGQVTGLAGPEVDGSGGATARSGGAGTGNAATVIPPSLEQIGATPSISGIPGTLRHDPELLGSPEAGWRRRKAAAEQKKGGGVSVAKELN